MAGALINHMHHCCFLTGTLCRYLSWILFMQAYNWVFRRTSICGFKNCFLSPFFVAVVLLPKVYFPNYHWKQKEFRWGQSKLICSFFFHHQISINTQWLRPWCRKVIYDGHSFQCAAMVPFNSVWLCKQKMKYEHFLGKIRTLSKDYLKSFWIIQLQ